MTQPNPSEGAKPKKRRPARKKTGARSSRKPTSAKDPADSKDTSGLREKLAEVARQELRAECDEWVAEKIGQWIKPTTGEMYSVFKWKKWRRFCGVEPEAGGPGQSEPRPNDVFDPRSVGRAYLSLTSIDRYWADMDAWSDRLEKELKIPFLKRAHFPEQLWDEFGFSLNHASRYMRSARWSFDVSLPDEGEITEAHLREDDMCQSVLDLEIPNLLAETRFGRQNQYKLDWVPEEPPYFEMRADLYERGWKGTVLEAVTRERTRGRVVLSLMFGWAQEKGIIGSDGSWIGLTGDWWEMQTTSKPTDHPASGENEAKPGNVFALRGNKLVVRYGDGEEFYLDNTKGARQIAYLLSRPNKPISALSLARIDEEIESGAPGSEFTGEKKQEILDHQAIRELKEKRDDYAYRIEMAEETHDWETAEELKGEAGEVNKELVRQLGLSGKSRIFSTAQRKAADSVGTNVRRTFKSVESADLALFRHLKSSIALGQDPCYAPTKATSWAVD